MFSLQETIRPSADFRNHYNEETVPHWCLYCAKKCNHAGYPKIKKTGEE